MCERIETRINTHRIAWVTLVTCSRRLGWLHTHSFPTCRGSRFPRTREAFLFFFLSTLEPTSPAWRTFSFQLPGNRHRVLAININLGIDTGAGSFPSQIDISLCSQGIPTLSDINTCQTIRSESWLEDSDSWLKFWWILLWDNLTEKLIIYENYRLVNSDK